MIHPVKKPNVFNQLTFLLTKYDAHCFTGQASGLASKNALEEFMNKGGIRRMSSGIRAVRRHDSRRRLGSESHNRIRY